MINTRTLKSKRARTPTTVAKRRPKGDSPTAQIVARFRRHKLAMVGLMVFTIVSLLVLFAPWVSRFDPNYIDLTSRNAPPSWEHWFGTDRTGRDVFARTLYAGRVSLSIGIVASGISIVIGAILGSIAGYFGGLVDNIIMRLTDVTMTFPPIIIILTVVALTGPGVFKTMLIIGLLNWTIPCRLVRSKFLSIRNMEFIQAGRAIGLAPWQLIVKHALPNTADVLVVYASFGIVSAIMLEAGLSFLGLGVQPPTASWGNMLNVARNLNVLQMSPWQWIPPGMAVVITVLSTNFIGDGIRDALDPRMRL